MSESSGDSRILPWPGPGRPPGPGPWPPGGWRPPVGPWPPGPPPGPGPFPQPPDVFSAFAWLAKNYHEARAAREFLKLLISDLIAEDPTFLANAHATVGVTDGSAAQPGMVGEIWQGDGTVNFPASATNFVTLTSMGVLPPGDWSVQAWLGSTVAIQAFSMDNIPSTDLTLTSAQQQALIPAGVGWLGVALGVGGAGGEGFNVPTLVTYARTAAPSLMILRTVVDSLATAGALEIGMLARRVR